MARIVPKLKHAYTEARIYSVVLESKTDVVLHIGVHFSLDEAVDAAKQKLIASSPHSVGDNTVVEMWTTLSGVDAFQGLLLPMPKGVDQMKSPSSNSIPKQVLTAPSAKEIMKQIRDEKNGLMELLIKENDLGLVEQSKDILGASQRSFIKEKIMESRNVKVHESKK